MSGVRRKQLHEESQKVSLWSLIFEKQEREAREKEMKKRKGKRIKWGLLFIPLLCMAEPNGYIRYNRSDDTYEVIADIVTVDTANATTVLATNITASGSLNATTLSATNMNASGLTMSADLDMGGYSIINLASNSITFTDGTTLSSDDVVQVSTNKADILTLEINSISSNLWASVTNGAIGGVFSNVTADPVQLDTAYTNGVEEGRLQWNSTDGTVEFGLPGGSVNLQVGQEMVMRVTNKSGATISNGVPVYISGAQGSRPTIAKADADSTNAYHAVAVTTEDISNNGNGYVTEFGLVRDIDTSSWPAGTDLFLSTVAGEMTNAAPAYPAESVHIGTVLLSDASNGIILASPRPEITYANIDSIYGSTGTNITASADYVGKTRYYTTAGNSYFDVCMQTGSNSFIWVNIQSYGW